MLYERIKSMSPTLASFLLKTSPELAEEDVMVLKPKGIDRKPGKCYLFSYRNPIGKGTPELPYYHVFPMVITLEKTPTHFLGLNLFYVPPKMREKILNYFMDKALIGSIDDQNSRVRINYKIIEKYAKPLSPLFPCIKRYNYEKMSSVVLEMKPSLWREFYTGSISQKHQSLFIGRSIKTIWNKSIVIAREEANNAIERRKK